jgi:multidrug resistance efflux pump
LPDLPSNDLPGAGLIRRATTWTLAILLAMVGALVLIGTTVEIHLGVPAAGTLEPLHVWRVGSADGGIVREVLVASGDTLSKGEVVARLDALDRREEMIQMEARYRAKLLAYQKASLALPINLRRQDELIAAAKAQLVSTRATLRQRMVDFRLPDAVDSLLQHYQVGGGSALDIAVSNVNTAVAQLHVAIEQRRTLELDELDLKSDSSELVDMRSQLRAARSHVARLDIRSPSAGLVLTSQPEQLVGTLVDKGAVLIEIAAGKDWMVNVLVPEDQVHRIQLGSRVRVQVPALRDAENDVLTGRVSFVAAQPEQSQGTSIGTREYRVAAVLDSNDIRRVGLNQLRRGYSVRAKIIVSSGSPLTLLLEALRGKLQQ